MLPGQSGKFISEHARHVSINFEKLQSVSDKILIDFHSQKRTFAAWSDHPLHPKEQNEKSLHWILLVDLLNFSFWSEDGTASHYSVSHNGVQYTGYFSLCAAINRALLQTGGVDLTNPQVYANISLDEARHIFRGDSSGLEEIPLLEERVACMHEIGTDLCKNYGGSFISFVEECNHSALKLLHKLTQYRTFRDEAVFHNTPVSFYKKAQILIGDLWSCFRGESWGQFHDIDAITAYADYRVPQTLVYFDILHYSDELLHTLSKGDLLKNGEPMEVEIRGCTVWAIELMVQFMRQKMTIQSEFPVNSILLDNYLWDYRREHADTLAHIPFHKTRSIYY